jgi:uncharacterized phage protein gp47/JayE
MVLSITQVTPITARFGEDSKVDISGTDFSSPLQVFIDTLDPIEALSVNVKSATLITCVVPGLIDVGTYDIRIVQGISTVRLINGIIVVQPFPSFPFTRQDFNSIMQRMLQRLPVGFDVREGSTFWDILAPVAIEISDLYNSINEGSQLGLITESVGVFLDLKATEYGITRNAAIKATVTISFTVSAAITIPKGTRVSNVVTPNETAIEFETDVDLVFAGAATDTVASTAVIAGTSGNLAATTITRLVSSVILITVVNNVAASVGGVEKETDEILRARALRRIREPSHGGNVGDYLIWAVEASADVAKVGVDPLGSGAGTVDVYILAANNVVAPAGLITIVQDYIDPTGNGGKSPIGATVVVASATLATQAIVVDITVSVGFTLADVIVAVTASLDKYFDDLPIGDDVIYATVMSIIINTVGVLTLNPATFTVAGGSVDVVIAASAKAMSGTYTIT